jgi:hypothetical protein
LTLSAILKLAKIKTDLALDQTVTELARQGYTN